MGLYAQESCYCLQRLEEAIKYPEAQGGSELLYMDSEN